MKQGSPPKHLDVAAFALSGGAIAGQNPLSAYPRLVLETQGLGVDHALNWSARGEVRNEAGGAGQVWLHLKVEVSLPLTCQRCLTPADIPIVFDRSYRFVGSEEEAEAQDAEAQEDVLVLGAEFSLPELIEDEVLMALPLIARHDSCPVPVKLAVADPGFDAALDQKRKPFSVLAQLKKGAAD